MGITHFLTLLEIIMTLPIATVERIAKEGTGVKRISKSGTLAIIENAESYIKSLTSKASGYATHAGRSTLKDIDVWAALGKDPEHMLTEA